MHFGGKKTSKNLETKKCLIFKISLKQNHIHIFSTFSLALKLSSRTQRFYWRILESLSADMLLILSYQHCFLCCNNKKNCMFSPFQSNFSYKFYVLLSSLSKNFLLNNAKFLYKPKCNSEENRAWVDFLIPQLDKLDVGLAFQSRQTPDHVL